MNYENYEELLAKYVLDRAAYFAQKEHRSRPIYNVQEIVLAEYVKTAVEFLRPVTLHSFPEQTFTKAIFYAKENLEKALKWINGVPWEIDGFPTTVNLGKCNLALLDFPLWNVPSFLVLHAPGKDYAVLNATIDPNELEEEGIAIRKQVVHDLRKVKAPLLEQIDQYKRGERQWRESFTHLKDKAEVERGYNLEQVMSEMEEKTLRRKRMTTWDYLLIVLLFVFFVIIIVWIVNFNVVNSQTNSTINSSTIKILKTEVTNNFTRYFV